MIALGLPSGTKWSCCNAGASKPEDYGGYYEWGQIADAPTDAQQVELKHYCTSVWTTLNGVNGRLFTGPNGGQVFLPAAGYHSRDKFYNVGSNGNYWSSDTFYKDGYYAYGLIFYSKGVNFFTTNALDFGYSVRPVAR